MIIFITSLSVCLYPLTMLVSVAPCLSFVSVYLSIYQYIYCLYLFSIHWHLTLCNSDLTPYLFYLTLGVHDLFSTHSTGRYMINLELPNTCAWACSCLFLVWFDPEVCCLTLCSQHSLIFAHFCLPFCVPVLHYYIFPYIGSLPRRTVSSSSSQKLSTALVSFLFLKLDKLIH